MRKLHDYMAEAMLEAVLPSPDPEISPGAWDEWLAEGARGIRKAALSRRDGARILMGSQPTGESSISFRAMVGRLEANGFSAEAARTTLVALGRYAMGCAAGDQMQGLALPSSEADFEFGLQAMLQGLARTTARRATA
jgi:TetR/AcrR family tetracycline transcriptional repressor